MHFRHRWAEVERIGRVVTERCTVCSRTRTRLRGPVRDSPDTGVHGPAPPPKGAQREAEPRREASQTVLCDTEQADPVEEALIRDRQSPDYHG